MIRKAAVANMFYPGDPAELSRVVNGFLDDSTREEALAIISPHAGYIYSGPVAGKVFSSVVVPDTVIIIGPNHWGLGENVSVMAEGSWETPLGDLQIDSELAGEIVASNPNFMEDRLAHLKEHSLEVQLPFIVTENPDAKIVPITVMHTDIATCRVLGEALAGVIKNSDKKILIIVSSDMNHHEDDKTTREKDKLAIDEVLKLDPEAMIKATTEKNITMCGAIPTAIALFACLSLGATQAKLIDYDTSATTSGDTESVVGYAGILIK